MMGGNKKFKPRVKPKERKEREVKTAFNLHLQFKPNRSVKSGGLGGIKHT